MYNLIVGKIIDRENGYYTVHVPFARINDVNYDLRVGINIKVETMNLEDNHSIELESPLSILKNGNYTEASDNLVVVVKTENTALQFFSQELEIFIDSEVRTKFPDEDASKIKQDFVNSICEFASENEIE